MFLLKMETFITSEFSVKIISFKWLLGNLLFVFFAFTPSNSYPENSLFG